MTQQEVYVNGSSTFQNGDGSGKAGVKLWVPSSVKSTNMWRFLTYVNEKHELHLSTYEELHSWSVANISDFWSDVWHFTGIQASKPFDAVMHSVSSSQEMFPRPTFFPGARLNFAENLLYPSTQPDPSSPALIAATETERETVSWHELRRRVRACQKALRALNVKPGDRVAGYLGNHAIAIVAMLAATSLGAIWTAVSPDSGVQMVVDRLSQIRPVVLFTDDGQVYNGKRFGVLEKVAQIVNGKVGQSVKHVVVWNVIGEDKSKWESIALESSGRKCLEYESFVALGKNEGKVDTNDDELYFEQMEADTPVYILYSSGTTGAPKCIVHGAIGTLIQHKKEHQLQCSVNAGEKVFYFTTVTWMMWHWLVSGLASGATLVLYDGSPMRYRDGPDDLAMPRLIDELGIQHFGTSAKYLSLLEQKNLLPKRSGIPMRYLKAIYNTASPLAPSTFHYVYRAFGPDIILASITGGTDIISLFGAASPLNPVYAGEVQVPGLGMAVRCFASPDSEDPAPGTDITASGAAGDLVCVKPFPCQPIFFWGQSSTTTSASSLEAAKEAAEAGAAKYRSSYFTTFGETVWHHGDFISINPVTGGLIMLGRSDGVLNPAGIRFGSAEIYNILLKHFPEDVVDSLCIGRRREHEDDETVCLFVKMADDHTFTSDLSDRIKRKVREDLSARHVPKIIEACPDIPVTVNGKKVEGEVKKIISGTDSAGRGSSTGKGSASVANVECLDWFRDWAKEN